MRDAERKCKCLSLALIVLFVLTTVGIRISDLSFAVSEGQILFEDDFEDRVMNGWNIVQIGTSSSANEGNGKLNLEVKDDDIAVEDSEGENIYASISSAESLDWENYVVEIDATIENVEIQPPPTGMTEYGYLEILFCSQSRTSLTSAYSMALATFQQEIILGKYINGVSNDLIRKSFYIEEGETYHLKVMMNRGSIQIYVDDTFQFQYVDNEFAKGTIALGGRNAGWEDVSVSFDNLQVRKLNNEPSALFTVNPISGNTETEFIFNAAGSSDTEDTGNLQFRWNWGGGEDWTDYSSASTSKHTYSTSGMYIVTLEVIVLKRIKRY